ncbi:hypothetical protein CK203_064429 [Vitis vinifera]|uniref:Uncharacterized protein n=1 Tax=Vitis vinifera TaxID=29760 RepID=A0A438FQF4_VITVI|nr:hypothetical protein CK203_064429 [Vitis vinifera]
MKNTTRLDILLCRKEAHLTPEKLDRLISGWHYINIGVVCGSTPSRSQSSAMSDEDYFVWRERMERCQQENDRESCTDVQGLSAQPTHLNSFMVPPSPIVFHEHISGYLGIFCGPLPMFCSPKEKYKHTVEHQVAGERVTERLHEEARSSKPLNQLRQASKKRASQQQQVRLTPLSISYERLISIICDLSDFIWPEPIKSDPARQDQNRRCFYHKNHNHTIEQCKSLHYLVEKLIKRSFSKGSVRSIDDIVTFSPVDANQVLQSHEDALLLTLGIYGFDVKRILVYPGSSVDLLQMSIYKQMCYSPSTLENLGCLLPGFNGATTTSLGDVVLPIQIGLVILNVWFSMVDDLSLYNVIMGRAWLYIMKFIPSTYHQMVSYLTEEGQVDLFGSQLATR